MERDLFEIMLPLFNHRDTYSEKFNKQCEQYKLSHGNDKDCALFIRLCLELETMQNDVEAKSCS